MRWLSAPALVALLLTCAVRATESDDPLPEGAIARCGNGRRLHGGVSHTEFAPDGKTLATSGADGARLWDVKTGAEIPLAYLPRSGYALLTFTPDGEHLVADDQGCRVYRATGKVRCFWRNAGKRPVGVVVAADGKSAATAWNEGGVSVHDLTGEGRRVGGSSHLVTLSSDVTLSSSPRRQGSVC
jgi:WD40 repeat protein